MKKVAVSVQRCHHQKDENNTNKGQILILR